MKITIFAVLWVVFQWLSPAQAQIYMTQAGETSFFSSTPIEDISAVNKNVAVAISIATGDVAVRIQNVQFKFPNKLMEEHFNENYMESQKYPTATFKGKIQEKIDFAKAGTYDISANGVFDIHGVKQERILKGKLTITPNQLTLVCDFEVKLVDHKIKIPKLVIAKVAEVITVKNKFVLTPKTP